MLGYLANKALICGLMWSDKLVAFFICIEKQGYGFQKSTYMKNTIKKYAC